VITHAYQREHPELIQDGVVNSGVRERPFWGEFKPLKLPMKDR